MQNAESESESRGPHPNATVVTVYSFTPTDCSSTSSPSFFLALGLMSKPVLVTWPFVMLLLDYWPLGRMRRMQKAECRMQQPATRNTQHATRLTFHVSRCTSHARLPPLARGEDPLLRPRGSGERGDLRGAANTGALAAGESLPLGARVGNALISYGRYLGKLFWPTDLAVVYPHPGQWPLAKVLLAGGLILGISALFWAGRRRYPCLLMGWLWYCGTLVPVIQIIQTGSHAMADRYMYLPALGGLILVTWGIYELTRGWRFQTLALAVAGGVAIFGCLVLTRQQIGYWRDSEALFRHALEVTENNDGAHNGLGIALDQKGQMDGGDPPVPGGHPTEAALRQCLLQPWHRAQQERPGGRSDPPIPGSHPPETGSSRRPLRPRHRPQQERPDGRGHRPIPGGHPLETGLRRGSQRARHRPRQKRPNG